MKQDMLAASWKHDCFLDAIAHGMTVHRTRDSFILDDGYARLLDDNQLRIREALLPLQQLADDERVRESSNWERIERLLDIYGDRHHNARVADARRDGIKRASTMGLNALTA